ncbi:MAG: hypothetical protein M3Z05_14540 [Gemmatimonadota bacterium]|nr:hypothetical protein [Gemmatimonadota bacterium]
MRATQQSTSPAAPSTAARAEAQAQVRQAIRDANQATRDAVQAARDASQAARDAGGFPSVPAPPNFPGAPGFGGFTVQNGGGDFGGMPPQAVDISIAFFITCAVIVIGWPISRAFGRRIERRGAAATVSAASADQLQRIEHAVDAMSIEIERISESQRFLAKLKDVNAGERDARGLKIPS